MSEQECQRCGVQAHDVDNIIERQFWGAIERETETVTSRRVRYVRLEKMAEIEFNKLREWSVTIAELKEVLKDDA